MRVMNRAARAEQTDEHQLEENLQHGTLNSNHPEDREIEMPMVEL